MFRLERFLGLLLVLLLTGFSLPAASARAVSIRWGTTGVELSSAISQLAVPLQPRAQSGGVTASDLILAMNTVRVSNGLPALIVDPIIMSVAQVTADIMAANESSWHIGDVRGRIAAAGYGGGATVWATENFAAAQSWGIDQIMLSWADPDHMRPATTPAYCHVGAGVSQAASGRIYYVLQAAYTSTNSCGPYTYPPGTGSSAPPVSQIIIPVKVATPDAEGKVYHIVKSGQSYWSIAVAYQITIADIEFWNNVSREQTLLVGQKLFIPSTSTEGYVTPTPVGMVVPAPPDAFGKIIHEVQPYQTLITIAAAYKVEVNRILSLNGLSIDWPLGVGQKLMIDPGEITDTPTPLSPLAKLTPAADGKYYHVVESGETLSYIAILYEISPANLMAWNGLNADSIIFVGDRLLLNVTPPVPPTATPGPPTVTPTITPTIPIPSPSHSPSPAPVTTSAPARTNGLDAGLPDGLIYGGVLAVIGLALLVGIFVRRNKES